ncbi:hypothetical protein Pint_13163 [Pistacia integerrima]|uniref:Uncharacterized protein n=1 Tax=Pistacia integerrima TaxID=434235 RepID=A0ACC0Y7J4_9ROSI|nr:hypothetical protein Pint_13163 [Pistacia integerrima]
MQLSSFQDQIFILNIFLGLLLPTHQSHVSNAIDVPVTGEASNGPGKSACCLCHNDTLLQ